MSNFLAVDASSRYLTVVAKKGERTVVRHLPDCAMRHSVTLMEEIDKALYEAYLSPEDCDFFAAVTGPGSFTGIRIGISCVKGFCSALGKRGVGVTSFDMLSYNVNSDSDYLVVIDAAHGNFYACGYRADKTADIKPCFLTRDEVVALGRPLYGFEELDLPAYQKLSVKDCLAPAVERAGETGGGLSALYVKKSQAEEEREARLGGV